MNARFWGVRGSVPTPSPACLRYGGNTLCVEVRTGEPASGKGEIVIFDCGTGFRALGKALTEEFAGRPLRAHVFLSHFHWDHIEGLRHFAPLYQPGNRIYFYSFHSFHPHGRETLRQLLRNPLYPVESKILSSVVRFQDVHGHKTMVDGTVVTVRRLNHPHGALGFRLDSGQQVIVYASDHEPDGKQLDANLTDLAEGADLLIYDAQYTPEEYASARRGWGHSTWKDAVELARRAHVKKLVLYHHDPDHSDEAIDEIVRRAREHFNDVSGATEGTLVDLSGMYAGGARVPASPAVSPHEAGNVPAIEDGLPVSALPALDVPPAGSAPGSLEEQESSWMDFLSRSSPNLQSEGSEQTMDALPETHLVDYEGVCIEEREVLPAEICVDAVPLYSSASIAGRNGAGDAPARPILPSAVRKLDWDKLVPEWAAPDRRRTERITMDGVAATAIVLRGEQRIPARVLDIGFGGIALDFEEHWILPNEFSAELHVPVWPAGTVRLQPIYANLNETGMRVGCRFATNGSREKSAGLAPVGVRLGKNGDCSAPADLRA